MTEYSFTSKLPMFHNRLLKVWKHYSKIARKQQITCFRFYDHDLPEFPFAIDFYEGVLHASEYKRRHAMEEEEHLAWQAACREIMATIVEVPIDDIFIKTRQRKEGRQGQYEKVGLEKREKIVSEGNLKFIINLTDYLDTGLFLDHRVTRNMVREDAEGKRVLNLFCYTGSFSVYAAAGGAASVTSVDLSKTYINWAKRNMQFNKLYDDAKHEFIQADVMEIIQELPAATYDLIICDPPTFSNSKRMDDIFDVQRDHVSLLKRLLKATTEEGIIYFSNNYHKFQLDKEAIPAFEIKEITGSTTPFDFQGRLNRVCYKIIK